MRRRRINDNTSSVTSDWPQTYTRRSEYHTRLTDSYGASLAGHRKFSTDREPNVVVSELPNGLHAPAIDIDLPCRLVPSRTPGHYHLYIDVQIPWEKYEKLLEVMVECGIVESEYLRLSRKDGKTVLRLPPDQNVYDNLRQRMLDGEPIFD